MAEQSIALDRDDAEQRKFDKLRRLNTVTIPLLRLGSFGLLLVPTYIHNRYLLGDFSWTAYGALVATLLAYCAVSWTIMRRYFGRTGSFDLTFFFLALDLVMGAAFIYWSGGEKSWLFFILIVRCADTSAFQSYRYAMFYAVYSVLLFLGLMGYLDWIEGRDIAWPVAFAKAALIGSINVHLVFAARIADGLRNRTATAVRTARTLIVELEEAKKRAETANRAKSEFLATMSHELRTPLNGILGALRLLRGARLSESERRNLDICRSSAQALQQEIDQLLDVSKIEAGRLELEATPFSPASVIERTMRELGIIAAEKGLRLDWALDPAMPDAMRGDPLRLRQLLLNLVGNAFKFTAHGSVSVEVRVEDRSDDAATLHLVVEDTGAGVPPEKREAIFEPFVQVDGSITRRFGGTGLGLTICRQVAERMGGRVWMEDRVPGAFAQGSRFHLTLRLALEDPARLPAAQETSPDAPELVASRRLLVLVAEDNPVNRAVLMQLLERWGHTASSVTSGVAALAAVADRSYDLVLMDLHMPELDGVQAAAAIRARERSFGAGGRRVPIVALSASVMAEDRERCLAAGMDEFVGKPIADVRLFEVIERLCGAPERATSAHPASLSARLDRTVARAFLDYAPGALATLRAALAARDASALGETAHSLAGALGHVGAGAAERAARQLEAAGKKGALDDAGALLATLEQLMRGDEARLRERAAERLALP